MNGNHVGEEDLALYGSNDLPCEKVREIEVHLQVCEECRAILKEFRQTQQMLTSAWPESSDADLLEVRRRVMSRLRRRPSWKWSAGTAVAAALLLFCLFQRRGINPTKVTPPPAALKRSQAILSMPELEPSPAATVVKSKRRTRHPVAPGLRSVVLITNPGEPPLIRMTTSDPDVIVVLDAVNPGLRETRQTNE